MIPDSPVRASSRLDPETSWTILTEGPLKGIGLAREAGTILAWDEADQLYLIDLNGQYRSVTRAPGKVAMATISDDGARVVLLDTNARLWLLDADLGVVAERQGPPDPIRVAIDPHGRYAVVSSRMGTNHFYTRFGKPAGKFESIQALAFVCFLADSPTLIGAADYGMLTAVELRSSMGSSRLSTETLWLERGVTSVGRLATTGDGSMILVSCFTHGVQRFDLHGNNEGAYHLGGTATHAVPDFAGRIIVVATLEGELVVLNSAGNVRWKSALSRPAIGLETDPLGRYVIYGQNTGEVVRLDLYPSERPESSRPRPAPPSTGRSEREPAAVAGPRGGSVRKPDWSIPVASSEEQAESSVLSVLAKPPRIALLSSNLRLQLFTPSGENLGFAPEIIGVGRIVRTSPGWIAGATDRQIVLYNATRSAAQRVDLSLVEVTHLAIRPETFGLMIVQERDRIGRSTISGRWVWKEELKSPVEEIAIGPEGYCAMTDDAGRLAVFDPAGGRIGSYQVDPPEPLLLIEAVEESPGGVVWMTLARNAQIVRGHALNGRVLWESPVPWEGWQFQRLGLFAAVVTPDGRVLAYDGAGHLRGQARATSGTLDVLTVGSLREPRRISRQGVNLLCADLDGRVRWRAVCDEPIGPIAAAEQGVAAIIGRQLAWFSGID